MFDTQFAIVDDTLYLKVHYLTGDVAFAPPRGEPCPDKPAYDRIIDYCTETGCRPRLCAVSVPRLGKLREMYPNLQAVTDRDWSDYLYEVDAITNLAGRRFSGQRNHINRFQRQYDDWVFETVGPANMVQTRTFFEAYTREHHDDYPAFEECNQKTLEVLDNYDAYRLLGGILKVGGEIVGGALGEVVGDTLFVHIEKANTDYTGAYPMLVNQYARQFAVGDVTRINREEDDGVEGLRTSKLSYHPSELLEKYVVTLD